MGTAEHRRLAAEAAREENWRRWGVYLPERQWGTVREDYSADQDVWRYLTHEDATARAYRWGEDGLLGWTDRQCRLCLAPAFWNGRDAILKERLFGLTGPEGNHGEDVKEEYFYLDATPTCSYAKGLYRYPQERFPYAELRSANARRSLQEGEFELADTGVFDENSVFDIWIEYAKVAPEDMLVRIVAHNRGPRACPLHVLPTLWFRNQWSWGATHEQPGVRPALRYDGRRAIIAADHETLGEFLLDWHGPGDLVARVPLFTENETNSELLFGTPNAGPYTKDAFHRAVIQEDLDAVNPALVGTRAALHFHGNLAPDARAEIRLRLCRAACAPLDLGGSAFGEIFAKRADEADEFYDSVLSPALDPAARAVARQAQAGLIWTRQFYHYIVEDWLKGDEGQPAPPTSRLEGRNREWRQIYIHDVLSMPDKWEYPWFAAWDLAFHMLPEAQTDPDFAQHQLLLLLREWYMHPNGQLPAYEFQFSDVNPPVHAWAAWRVYKMTGPRGKRNRPFLEAVFQKLLLNFTWWVNRKDADGNNLFSGGFLGLDNIGVFDRSRPLPDGSHLQQADGTAWMAVYSLTMLGMALELAVDNPVYEDLASKFFEHFIQIVDAMNGLGGSGLWDEEDGFYYDLLRVDGEEIRLRTRSLVGLLPLIAAGILPMDQIERLEGFHKRMEWFVEHRPDLARHIAMCPSRTCDAGGMNARLLAVPSRERLERLLRRMFDESEFFSPYGIRSLSKAHETHPFRTQLHGETMEVRYAPGESDSRLFGGNSNWRGPVWFPVNYLIYEALERYHHFYGSDLTVELPTGSGHRATLAEAKTELGRRLTRLFLPDGGGRRPYLGGDARHDDDPVLRQCWLFHEYFHGDTGRGLGASHQTGWTALVALLLRDLAAEKI